MGERYNLVEIQAVRWEVHHRSLEVEGRNLPGRRWVDGLEDRTEQGAEKEGRLEAQKVVGRMVFHQAGRIRLE